MNTVQRRYEIYERIKKQKTVDVNELSNLYNVSSMTIRRDLTTLENQGLVTKTYGGASLNESKSNEPAFSIKAGISQVDKKKIAASASQLIQDGDSIYIDCGTTSLELFKRILHKRITIITNFWKVLAYVDQFTKAKIIMAPGAYNPVTQDAMSEITIEFLKDYYFDKVFISSLGVDLEFGASIPNMTDALVKKELLKVSNYKVLLADHTKFDQKYMSKIADLKEFDCIITDVNISEETLKKYEEFNIQKAM